MCKFGLSGKLFVRNKWILINKVFFSFVIVSLRLYFHSMSYFLQSVLRKFCVYDEVQIFFFLPFLCQTYCDGIYFFQRFLCTTKLIFSCTIYIDFKLTETCRDSFVGMERKDGCRGYSVSNEIREIKRNSGIGDLEENTWL